eukprot:g4948.t1
MDSESRNKRMLRYGGVVLGIGVAGFVMKSYFSHITNRPIHRIRSLNKYEKSFRIPDSRAISLVKDFEEQLQQGLLAVNGSSLKMTPPWITALPTGFERGEFYSIDVGRSNLSIMYCHLGDLPNEILGEHSKAIGIPREHKTGSIQMLFNFIVTSFKIYMQMNGKQTGTEPLKIGFCCDFPLKIEATNVGFIEDLPQVFISITNCVHFANEINRQSYVDPGLKRQFLSCFCVSYGSKSSISLTSKVVRF